MRGLLKNKVASNAIWIIVGRIVQSLLSLFVGMLTARYLGPSNYGLITYAASVVAFVIPIMNLGFSNTLVQEVTNHPDEEGDIFGSSILLSLCSALVCIIGVTSYTFIVDANEHVTNCVVILYSVILIFQAFELIQYWFQAKLLSKYMSIASLIAYAVVAAYKIVLLINRASVYFFAISNSLDYLLIAIFLFTIYKKLGGQRLHFSKDIAKRMVSNSKHYIVSSLMVTVFAQTDRIMLKLMINETAVGYYSAAVACAGLTSFVFAAIIDSMRPSILSHRKIKDIQGYEKGIELTYCIVIYLALAQSVVMTFLSKYIIGILYGIDYQPSVAALRIVVWYTTFSYMGSVRNIWILGEGKQRYLWIINLSGALTNIALNYLLIPNLGINGAAVASLITQFFTNIIVGYLIKPIKYNNKLIAKGMNPLLLVNILKKQRL